MDDHKLSTGFSEEERVNPVQTGVFHPHLPNRAGLSILPSSCGGGQQAFLALLGPALH